MQLLLSFRLRRIRCGANANRVFIGRGKVDLVFGWLTMDHATLSTWTRWPEFERWDVSDFARLVGWAVQRVWLPYVERQPLEKSASVEYRLRFCRDDKQFDIK